jgi:hypothetical protein
MWIVIFKYGSPMNATMGTPSSVPISQNVHQKIACGFTNNQFPNARLMHVHMQNCGFQRKIPEAHSSVP